MLSTLLVGCIRVELALKVHEDGSGVIELVGALDDAFFGLSAIEDVNLNLFEPLSHVLQPLLRSPTSRPAMSEGKS